MHTERMHKCGDTRSEHSGIRTHLEIQMLHFTQQAWPHWVPQSMVEKGEGPTWASTPEAQALGQGCVLGPALGSLFLLDYAFFIHIHPHCLQQCVELCSHEQEDAA